MEDEPESVFILVGSRYRFSGTEIPPKRDVKAGKKLLVKAEVSLAQLLWLHRLSDKI